MSTEEQSGDQEEPEKGKSKLMFIIIGVVVLLVAGGGGAYFMGFFDSSEELPPIEAKLEQNKPSAFLELEEITVNLNADGNREKYAKFILALEVKNEEIKTATTEVLPLIRDAFLGYLREARPEDLKGSKGYYLLKEALLKRANIITAPLKVENVLFKEIIIQ